MRTIIQILLFVLERGKSKGVRTRKAKTHFYLASLTVLPSFGMWLN